MDSILETVKQITVFVLVFSVVLNVFAGSKYIRYFRFLEGILLILLVMMPLFSWLLGGTFFEDFLNENLTKRETEFDEEELQRIGEEREQMLVNDWGGIRMKDEWGGKAKEWIQKTGPVKLSVVIISGILLLLLSCGGLPGGKSQTESGTSGDSSGEAVETETDLQRYQERMEQKVENILGKVEGVEDVDVMITLRAGGEKVALKDSKVDSDKSEEETVLTEDENNCTSPYVVQETEPEIEGILIVCSQGDSPSVQREIIEGISALFSVESHKIKVMKSKEAEQ